MDYRLGIDALGFRGLCAALAWIGVLVSANPAFSFCVRNDTGFSIAIEATGQSANFSHRLANNKKICCEPKDEACAIGKAKVTLSISAFDGEATCDVAVSPKGQVNVTGKSGSLKCKANKAGSTMDWASG